MIPSCKEFTYSTADALAADLKAWFDELKAAKKPARDFKINFITTTRVLVTATFGNP